jgi:hypothetical protein
VANAVKKMDNWLEIRNASPDRKAAIAGMTKLSLGGEGGARVLFFSLVQSLNADAFGAEYKSGALDTWADAFNELKTFESKVKAAAQREEWMKGQRDRWFAFCNNVDCQHPAGFATAVLALEISINGSAQGSQWLNSDRAGWVKKCEESGAKQFDWAKDGFICSGLDGCEVLMEDIIYSMKEESMSSPWDPADYKSYGQLFAALKAFEQRVRASCQVSDWMSAKRSKWVQFCDDTKNHSPTGFATAVLALDISIPIIHQNLTWVAARPTWVTRCKNAGAVNFNWA